MYSLNQLKTLVSCGRDPARSLPLRRGFLLIPLILVGFAFSPKMQAAPRPETPDPGAVGGVLNTADGLNALPFISAGLGNSAFGAFAQFSNVAANFNTAVGAGALDLTNTDSNTAVGTAALLLNAAGAGANTGTQNTAVGTAAMVFNTGGANEFDGSFNDAVGAFALNQNTIGAANNAFGNSALFNNTIGSDNTAIGDVALGSNVGDALGNGSLNTAVGAAALFTSNDASDSNAVGALALGGTGPTPPPNTGVANNAFGVEALEGITTGSGNVAVGDSAGLSLADGSFNIYVGFLAGSSAAPDEEATIRIGDPDFVDACFVGGIFGVTTGLGDAVPVVVDSNGQLGTLVSSERFKDNIKPMDKASEAILSLKPVTFHYKKDKSGKPQFGLVAEEVAAVNPDLVVRDRNGEILTVRYEAVNAMLLNEFLKEHRMVQDLKSTMARQEELITKQQEGLAVLTAQLKEQAAEIQRVSAKVEVSRPAPQVVENR